MKFPNAVFSSIIRLLDRAFSMYVTELTTKNAPLWRNRVRSLVESSLPVRERKILRAKLVRKQRGKVLTQSDIRLRETRRTILSKVVSAVQKVQRLYNRMRMTKYALLPGESASRHELSWMRGCSVDVRTDCQGQRLGAYQREVGHRVGRTGDSDDVFLACVGEGSGQSSHPVSIELRMNQPSFQAKRSVAGSATPAPSRAHFSTAKVTGSRRRHLSCQCMHTALSAFSAHPIRTPLQPLPSTCSASTKRSRTHKSRRQWRRGRSPRDALHRHICTPAPGLLSRRSICSALARPT